MKRILIFSLQYYPLVGGAEVAIKEITDRIAHTDIEFHMVTLHFNATDAREEQYGNVFIHRIGSGSAYVWKILYVPLAAIAARRLHRQHAFDGAWAMMSYMAFPAVLLRITGVRVPYVLTLQDGDPFERVFARWYIKPLLSLLRYGFRNARAISALSAHLAGWVTRMGYQGHIEIIPNGADTKRFADADPFDIGRKPGETWLVTSSRLVHKNAVDDVIRALALLPMEVHFLVLGTGPDEAELKSLADGLGLDARVHFKGYVSHDELPGYLHACDIFVRPSRTEGFGASFPEAMAAGLPVIATQEGGIADFLFDAKRNPDHEPTGFAADKDSPEQIAERVKEILADPEGTKRVVRNARALVLEKYDWDLVARAMEHLFDSLWRKGTIAPMRLLIATPLYPPDPGGPATYARVLEEGLPGRGIDVSLMKFGDVRKYPKLLRHIIFFWRVYRAARHADVVLALDPVSVGLPAWCAARLARKPFVVKVVGDYAWEQGRQRFGIWQSLDDFVQTRAVVLPVHILRTIETFIAAHAVRVIVPSEYLKRIVTLWGVESEHITVIANAEPNITPGTIPESIQALGTPRIVTVARLVPWKGIHGLVTAMLAVRQMHPQAELIIIGDGPDRDALLRYATIRLKEGFTFTGAIENAEALAIAAASDVFVLNSTYEGLSHVLLEALALGKAIVATKAGGNPEVIEHGVNGLLISVGDTDALAESILSILSDAKGRAKLEAGAKASATRYAPERMLEATAELLKTLS